MESTASVRSTRLIVDLDLCVTRKPLSDRDRTQPPSPPLISADENDDEMAKLQISQTDTENQSSVLRALVDCLPERHRRVLTLFYYEDRSVAEVAAKLAMPVGTVKTPLHRARAALSEQLTVRGLDLTALDVAVDTVLVKMLVAPALPIEFRERFRAALSRAGDGENIETQRARLEREHRAALAALRLEYLRLRRRTLAALIGGTFAVGAGVVHYFHG